jgi:SulP family sulfate permease
LTQSPPRDPLPIRFHARDIMAGLAVALVLIPQSLAYAELAGLPAHRGLYAAALAPMAAAFFASSPWLQTGPVALTSLLTLGALIPLAATGTPEFVALAALLALVVAGARLLIGLLKLGWTAFLLSQPVLMGFTAAAALLIIGSQLPAALGVTPPMANVGPRVIWALSNSGSWNREAIGLSMVTVALMFGSRKIHPAIPGVLLASLVGWGFSVASDYQGATVGSVPVGLLSLQLDLPWGRLPGLVLPGVVIAMVGFAEAASVSQTYATRERRRWDPNKEFVGQGMANLASGIVGGFPVGGSFSRTSLAYLAGARTRWAGFFAGLTVLLFLPFAAVLAPLPTAVLSAVVISAVFKLVRFGPLLRMWRLSPPQAVIGWITFFLTLALAPHVEEAVILSVTLALGLHLWRELTPGFVATSEGDTLHLELRGVLWFGSAPLLERGLITHLEGSASVKKVVLHLGGLGRVDLTGAMVLRRLREDVEQSGVVFEFREVPGHACRILRQVMGWGDEEEERARGLSRLGSNGRSGFGH